MYMCACRYSDIYALCITHSILVSWHCILPETQPCSLWSSLLLDSILQSLWCEVPLPAPSAAHGPCCQLRTSWNFWISSWLLENTQGLPESSHVWTCHFPQSWAWAAPTKLLPPEIPNESIIRIPFTFVPLTSREIHHSPPARGFCLRK